MKTYFSVFLRKFPPSRKLIFIIILCVLLLVFYEYKFYERTLIVVHLKPNEFLNTLDIGKPHSEIVDSFYEARKAWPTSNLGSVLFKNADSTVFEDKIKQNKIFTIFVWKYWDWLKNRHVFNFGHDRTGNPLNGCSVSNCKFTQNDEDLNSADAVLVHLQRGEIPNVTKRMPNQRWVFLTDESARHTFSLAKIQPNLSDLAYKFNWSMSYRSDSDVPVPYGRTLPLSVAAWVNSTHIPLTELVPNWKRKRRDILATVLMSNCGVPHRMNYLNELKKHLTVDVHGKCSEDLKNSCPGHFAADCTVISEYLFYLVLENSLCQEYLTEKAFYHAYNKGAIPVIMGPTADDCEKLLPPNSYLHVDNYATPKDIAEEIINLSQNITKLLSLHEWRRHFEVVNEHGYFGSKSKHYCRLCEALNYNDEKTKVYDEISLRNFLDPTMSCR